MFIVIIRVIIGCIVLGCSFGIILLLYHAQSQDMWRDITHDEYEERYDKEIEARWHSQRVKIHQQLRIVDEMHGKGEDYYDEYHYYRRSV